ncbi:MAG TPA: glycosyltransferase family 2 protein [Acidimicrobiales bacterium]
MRKVERSIIFGIFLAISVAIIAFKAATMPGVSDSIFWGTYSVLVTAFLLSRFVLGALYRPNSLPRDPSYRPSVTVIVPAMNEEDGIGATLDACLASHYPAELLEVIAVDDGSTDGTLSEMRAAADRHPGRIQVLTGPNGGKRHAMARGIERATGEILIFVDSDSFVAPDAIATMVEYFSDPAVGAVTGHTDVANRDTNVLTKMQAVRYYVAFKAYKSAEALYDSVTCCSGCFSGYRKSAVDPVVETWLNQTFLGAPSTFGDDRSLTNFLLPKWKVLFAPDAKATTVVPDRYQKFFKQQLRWKKSWIRETLRASSFMWRKHPVAAASFYVGFFLPLIGPAVVLRTLVVGPLVAGRWPVYYVGGVLVMALLYGLYYRIHRRERLWIHGASFALLYALVLVWQLPWAVATLRDSKWGTR